MDWVRKVEGEIGNEWKLHRLVVTDLCSVGYTPKSLNYKSTHSKTSNSTTKDRINTRTCLDKGPKNRHFTDLNLDHFVGVLKNILDHTNLFHYPSKVIKKETSCQMHYWDTNKRCRKCLLQCELCEVTLCVDFFGPFHLNANLGSRKHYYRILLDDES